MLLFKYVQVHMYLYVEEQLLALLFSLIIFHFIL